MKAQTRHATRERLGTGFQRSGNRTVRDAAGAVCSQTLTALVARSVIFAHEDPAGVVHGRKRGSLGESFHLQADPVRSASVDPWSAPRRLRLAASHADASEARNDLRAGRRRAR